MFTDENIPCRQTWAQMFDGPQPAGFDDQAVFPFSFFSNQTFNTEKCKYMYVEQFQKETLYLTENEM